jgi:hypothetical protein
MSERKHDLTEFSEIEIIELNRYCWERVGEYQSLNICGQEVSTPYFINRIEEFFVQLMKNAGISHSKIIKVTTAYRERSVPYGWYKGKGTPQEITNSVREISEIVGLPLEGSSAESITDFMKLYGLGIDCSGFVYNTLDYAFRKQGYPNLLNELLDWEDPAKRSVYRAGTFTFASKASEVIKPQEVRPLDLVLLKLSDLRTYNHIALTLRDGDVEGEGLVVVQSSLNTPTGVNITKMALNNGVPVFDYIPDFGKRWAELYECGRLEFRRLKI